MRDRLRFGKTIKANGGPLTLECIDSHHLNSMLRVFLFTVNTLRR
jgi:hypothetical protein